MMATISIEAMRKAAAMTVETAGRLVIGSVQVFKAIDNGELSEAHRLLYLLESELGQIDFMTRRTKECLDEYARRKARGPVAVVKFD